MEGFCRSIIQSVQEIETALVLQHESIKYRQHIKHSLNDT